MQSFILGSESECRAVIGTGHHWHGVRRWDWMLLIKTIRDFLNYFSNPVNSLDTVDSPMKIRRRGQRFSSCLSFYLPPLIYLYQTQTRLHSIHVTVIKWVHVSCIQKSLHLTRRAGCSALDWRRETGCSLALVSHLLKFKFKDCDCTPLRLTRMSCTNDARRYLW